MGLLLLLQHQYFQLVYLTNLDVNFVQLVYKVEVLVVADNVGKADAAAMYKEVL